MRLRIKMVTNSKLTGHSLLDLSLDGMHHYDDWMISRGAPVTNRILTCRQLITADHN